MRVKIKRMRIRRCETPNRRNAMGASEASGAAGGNLTLLPVDLHIAIQGRVSERAGHRSAVRLTGVYHFLIRTWAEL